MSVAVSLVFGFCRPPMCMQSVMTKSNMMDGYENAAAADDDDCTAICSDNTAAATPATATNAVNAANASDDGDDDTVIMMIAQTAILTLCCQCHHRHPHLAANANAQINDHKYP